jgi:preprotein translocase subunit YajC
MQILSLFFYFYRFEKKQERKKERKKAYNRIQKTLNSKFDLI